MKVAIGTKDSHFFVGISLVKSFEGIIFINCIVKHL